tara:strand:- start:2 stop:331 length:330 start_codon:yes stop_codon:yes gene_type:complete
MKYFLIIFAFIIWAALTWSNNAKANDYTTATTAHIITEVIKGTDLNEAEILNAETQRQIHKMSLEIVSILFKSLPNILDGISAQLRQEADKKYKCSLQSKDYKNEECDD